MTEKDPIRIFITHEFAPSDEYSRVFEYLESRDQFYYVNCSTPEDKPAGGREAIEESLRNQIKRAEVVIFPVGCIAESSPLLRFQFTVAQAFDKPILGIQSFGSTVTLSVQTLDICTDMVEWNDRIITDALRRLARDDESGSWDVIEFDTSDLDLE